MTSTRAAAALACAALLTLSVGLLALELAFGFWLRDADWSRLDRMNVARDWRRTYDVRHIHGPDAPPVRYTRNRYGLRSGCTAIAAMQMVTLGGSTTDQVYIDDEHTWQEVMRRDLNAAIPGLGLCVANAGVDGHTTFGHVEAMRHWLPMIPDLRPRVVMLYIGINDAAMRLQRGALDEVNLETPAGVVARAKQAVKDNSALFRAWTALRKRSHEAPVFAAHKLIDPKESDYASTEPTPGIDALVAQNTEAFRRRLLTLLDQIKDLGAKPACVSQPSIVYKRVDERWLGITKVFTYEGTVYNGLDYRLSLLSLNQAMQRECVAAGGWYIDLEGKPFPASDFYDGVHMTPSGAARVGSYLADELQRQGIASHLSGVKR